MIKNIDKNAIRVKRHERIRNKISGTASRPRLSVYRSTNHIYVQIIDDVAGNTLCSASTLYKEVQGMIEDKTKKEASRIVGKVAAERALKLGIEEAVFDRGGYLYTGRVAEVADGAREAGLRI